MHSNINRNILSLDNKIMSRFFFFLFFMFFCFSHVFYNDYLLHHNQKKKKKRLNVEKYKKASEKKIYKMLDQSRRDQVGHFYTNRALDSPPCY